MNCLNFLKKKIEWFVQYTCVPTKRPVPKINTCAVTPLIYTCTVHSAAAFSRVGGVLCSWGRCLRRGPRRFHVEHKYKLKNLWNPSGKVLRMFSMFRCYIYILGWESSGTSRSDPIPILGVTIRFQNDSWSTYFPQLIFCCAIHLYNFTS